jgi:hypothetical protein
MLLSAVVRGGEINIDVQIMAVCVLGVLVVIIAVLYLLLRRKERPAAALISVVASVCLIGSTCAYITTKLDDMRYIQTTRNADESVTAFVIDKWRNTTHVYSFAHDAEEKIWRMRTLVYTDEFMENDK